MIRRLSVAAVTLLAAAALHMAVAQRAAIAQQTAIPSQDWRTVETEHFTVHYPRALDQWTQYMAARLEAVQRSVASIVGYSPSVKTTVIVDDPLNTANGYAIPGPLIFLYPTPPDPRAVIGENRDWAELLSVHEFTHIAHTARPSRNPTIRFLNAFLPVQIGPIAVAPRWVTEGYATYVEGKLTGSGRPHGVWRPTLIRQFALTGSLPRYSQLDASEGFYASSMAYMVGSAFLEWLAEKEGEESLVNVWRRMSARTQRGFAAAFAGVYGAAPDELYGRFTAEVTALAMQLEEHVDSIGRREGELFQRFTWYTGDPALSADGRYLALPVRARLDPTRIVVLSTAADTLSDAAKRAAEHQRQLDPEDVSAVARLPRPHRQLATLESPPGSSWDSPRFVHGGDRVLLTRPTLTSAGALRHDLFEWRWRDDEVRRITHDAGVRYPDPAPGGGWAAAVQCTGGVCSVVRVSLGDGSITVLARGSPSRVYYRPRVMPNGRDIVASLQESGRWRLVILDASSGNSRYADPDDGASRFDAEPTRDGSRLVTVTSAGGIFNLELIELTSGQTRRITNVPGAAFAPVPTAAGDSAYFLALHSRGYDVRRIALQSAAPSANIADGSFAPVNRRAGAIIPSPAAAQLPQSQAYGLGPQRLFWLPVGGGDAYGVYAGGLIASADPVGRFTTVAMATAGDADAWRGGSIQLALRSFPLELGAAAHVARKRFTFQGATPGTELSVDYRGFQLHAEKRFESFEREASVAAGGWVGRVRETSTGSDARTLAFVELGAGAVQNGAVLDLSESLNANIQAGRTAGHAWTRVTASVSALVRSPGPDLRLAASGGHLSSSAPAAERFLIGADRSPHLDPRTSANLLPAPYLRGAVDAGNRFTQARAELSGLLPLQLFAEWTWPGGDSEYFATVGACVQILTPRMPQLAAPGVNAVFGVGSVIAGTGKRRATLFGMLRVRS